MTDLRQSPQYARFLELQGWQVKKDSGVYSFTRRLSLFNITKIQRPKHIPQSFPQSLITHVEPSSLKQVKTLIPLGFKPQKSAFLPTKTIEINLQFSLAKIKSQMKKDARYLIRRALITDIKILELRKSLEDFHHVWKKTTGFWRWPPSLKTLQNLQKAFGQNVLFLAACSPNGQIISGTIILIAEKKAYYYYAFNTQKGRQLGAQYLLVWQAIKETKKSGCQFFDLEGIYDPRFSNPSWLGFSHFKKSFGGQEVEYPGCWQKINVIFPRKSHP